MKINTKTDTATKIFTEPHGDDIYRLKVDSEGYLYACTLYNLYRLNDSGGILWSFSAPGSTMFLNGGKNVAIDDERNMVYVVYYNSDTKTPYLVQLNRLSGSLLFTRSFGTITVPFIRTPVVGPDGVIYIGIYNTYYALYHNAITGTPKWTKSIIGRNGCLNPEGTTIYIPYWQQIGGIWYNKLAACNTSDGTEKWAISIQQNPDTDDIWQPYVAGNDVVCFTVETGGTPETYTVYAYRDNGSTAQYLWEYDAGTSGGDFAFGPGATLYFWGLTGDAQTIYALSEGETGDPSGGGMAYTDNGQPVSPSSPIPADGAEDQSTESVELSWTCSDPDGHALKYDIFACALIEEEEGAFVPVACGLTENSYTLTGLQGGTNYLWTVVATDGQSIAEGLVWSFTTAGSKVMPAVEAGGFHTVALKEDGTVWTWGDNAYGQLGDDTSAWRYTPVQVLGPGGTGFLTGVKGIAAGDFHTVALKGNGTVSAWGYNYFGQLGDNTTDNHYTPIQVLGMGGTGFLTEVKAVAAGHSHTVALKTDGTVWAWGWNMDGQVGNDSTMNTSTPIQVMGPGGAGFLTGVKAIAAGHSHTVALKTDGTVWAWGDNSEGQLGDDSTVDRHVPIQVMGPGGAGFLTGVKAIAAGHSHTVALKTDGTVWAWGDNSEGQLGDDSTVDRHVPDQVMGPGGVGFLTGVIAVTAGGFHTVALKDDGTVWAWGYNDNGQLGDNTSTEQLTPVQVLGPGGTEVLTSVRCITAGMYHSAGLKNDGTVWAWGCNGDGQLGNGTTADAHTPSQVLGQAHEGYLNLGTGPAPGTGPVRILDVSPVYFNDIQTAYNAALDCDVIQIQEGNFPEDLVLDFGIRVTIAGGWNAEFTAQASRTTIQSLTILDGMAIVEGLTIAQSATVPTDPRIALINPDAHRILKMGEFVEGESIGQFYSTASATMSDSIEITNPDNWTGVGVHDDFIASVLTGAGYQVDEFEASSMPSITASSYDLVIIQDPLRTNARAFSKDSENSLPDLLEYSTDSGFLSKIGSYFDSGGRVLFVGDAVRLMEDGAGRLNWGKTVLNTSIGNTPSEEDDRLPDHWLFIRGNPFCCYIDRNGSGEYRVNASPFLDAGTVFSAQTFFDGNDRPFIVSWSDTVYYPADGVSLLSVDMSGSGDYVLSGESCDPPVYTVTVSGTVPNYFGYTLRGSRKVYYIGSDSFFDYHYKNYDGAWHCAGEDYRSLDSTVTEAGKGALCSLVGEILKN